MDIRDFYFQRRMWDRAFACVYLVANVLTAFGFGIELPDSVAFRVRLPASLESPLGELVPIVDCVDSVFQTIKVKREVLFGSRLGGIDRMNQKGRSKAD